MRSLALFCSTCNCHCYSFVKQLLLQTFVFDLQLGYLVVSVDQLLKFLLHSFEVQHHCSVSQLFVFERFRLFFLSFSFVLIFLFFLFTLLIRIISRRSINSKLLQQRTLQINLVQLVVLLNIIIIVAIWNLINLIVLIYRVSQLSSILTQILLCQSKYISSFKFNKLSKCIFTRLKLGLISHFLPIRSIKLNSSNKTSFLLICKSRRFFNLCKQSLSSFSLLSSSSIITYFKFLFNFRPKLFT